MTIDVLCFLFFLRLTSWGRYIDFFHFHFFSFFFFNLSFMYIVFSYHSNTLCFVFFYLALFLLCSEVCSSISMHAIHRNVLKRFYSAPCLETHNFGAWGGVAPFLLTLKWSSFHANHVIARYRRPLQLTESSAAKLKTGIYLLFPEQWYYSGPPRWHYYWRNKKDHCPNQPGIPTLVHVKWSRRGPLAKTRGHLFPSPGKLCYTCSTSGGPRACSLMLFAMLGLLLK